MRQRVSMSSTSSNEPPIRDASRILEPRWKFAGFAGVLEVVQVVPVFGVRGVAVVALVAAGHVGAEGLGLELVGRRGRGPASGCMTLPN